MRLLACMLCPLMLAVCAPGMRGSGRRGVPSYVGGRMLYAWQVEMNMPGMGMAVASHQARHEKEAKAQQEAEDEDQGKWIMSDQSIPSFRGNTCLARPQTMWGSFSIDGLTPRK